MDRRIFIKNFSMLAAYGLLPSCASIANRNLSDKENRQIAFCTILENQKRSELGIFDPTTSELQFHFIPVLTPHDLIQNPVDHNILVVAPKGRNVAAVFDRSKNQVLKTIELQNGDNFYGHGFFSNSGDKLFLSGFDKTGAGFLREYDLNWKAVGNINSFGRAPHDARMIENGETILIANNGWVEGENTNRIYVTSMAYVDIKSRQLIEKIELPHSHLVFQHFDCNENGDFVVGCDYFGEKDIQKLMTQSLVGYRKRGQDIQFLQASPAELKNIGQNILSIRWDQPSHRVVTTGPEGPVTIWDLKEMKATSQILNGKSPMGVTLDSDHAWVTTAFDGIWKFDYKNDNKSKMQNLTQSDPPGIQKTVGHSKWIRT